METQPRSSCAMQTPMGGTLLTTTDDAPTSGPKATGEATRKRLREETTGKRGSSEEPSSKERRTGLTESKHSREATSGPADDTTMTLEEKIRALFENGERPDLIVKSFLDLEAEEQGRVGSEVKGSEETSGGVDRLEDEGKDITFTSGDDERREGTDTLTTTPAEMEELRVVSKNEGKPRQPAWVEACLSRTKQTAKDRANRVETRTAVRAVLLAGGGSKRLDVTAMKKSLTDKPSEVKQQAAVPSSTAGGNTGRSAESSESELVPRRSRRIARGKEMPTAGATTTEKRQANVLPSTDRRPTTPTGAAQRPASELSAWNQGQLGRLQDRERARWNTLISAAHEALAGGMAAARRRAFETDADAYSFMVF